MATAATAALKCGKNPQQNSRKRTAFQLHRLGISSALQNTFRQDRMEALIGSEILQPLVCGAIT